MAKKERFIQGVTNYEEYKNILKLNKTYLRKRAIVNAMLEKQEKGEEITLADQVLLVSLIGENALTGKLDGFFAVSTSVHMNERCQNRAKCEGCICADCYASATLNQYDSLSLSMEINTDILRNFNISEEAWATLRITSTNGKSRIEAFGDTNNVLHATNYLRIIKTHRWLDFGVWSKNAVLDYLPAFKAMGKPSNMVFILSSSRVNIPDKVPTSIKPYVDHVFTVYTKDYAEKHNIKINCGTYEGTHPIDYTCRNCGRCYDVNNDEFYINELKK